VLCIFAMLLWLLVCLFVCLCHVCTIVRENVWSKAIKRKKSRFFGFSKKRKKNVKKRNSNNMYCRPKFLGLNTALDQICCPIRNYEGHIYYKHTFFWVVLEIPCSERSAKSETSNYGLRFLRFFEMPLQKNVKSRVFWIFKKKRKKRILELWCAQSSNQTSCLHTIFVHLCPAG